MNDQPDEIEKSKPAVFLLRWAAILFWLWAVWWLMMATHEAGHVFAAWATGGQIDRVELSPLAFSHTELITNPEPMMVVWAGPVCGVIAPLLLWLGVLFQRKRKWASRDLQTTTFLAGFCLVANGGYIGLGWLDRVGDTNEMLHLGTPIPVMIAFGLVSTCGGLALWHRLGPLSRLKQITTPYALYLLTTSLLIVGLGFAVAHMIG